MPDVTCPGCQTTAYYRNIEGRDVKGVPCVNCHTPLTVPYKSAHHMSFSPIPCPECGKPGGKDYMVQGKRYLSETAGSHGLNRKMKYKPERIIGIMLCDDCQAKKKQSEQATQTYHIGGNDMAKEEAKKEAKPKGFQKREKTAEEIAVEKRVVALGQKGSKPKDIAAEVKIDAKKVRRILRAAGIFQRTGEKKEKVKKGAKSASSSDNIEDFAKEVTGSASEDEDDDEEDEDDDDDDESDEDSE